MGVATDPSIEIEKDRQNLIDELTAEHGPDWAAQYRPGSFGCHELLDRTSLLQYMTFQFFAISVLFLFPIKLLLRLLFTIKYIWVTPWFNV